MPSMKKPYRIAEMRSEMMMAPMIGETRQGIAENVSQSCIPIAL